MTERPVCIPKYLKGEDLVSAAEIARRINPANHPPLAQLAGQSSGFEPTREQIAVVTTKFWGTAGVRLTVGFLDNPDQTLRNRILENMNAWSRSSNVQFTETDTDPQVRISRSEEGYWSYLGTDILTIRPEQPTMNLEGFTNATSDSEFHRVVRHETGHTLGCPHEHMRKEFVELIDPQKAIKYFGETQGWTPEEVRQQVLTPLEESSLWGTARPDMYSIMCYEIPGTITKNGQPIVGGTDIDPSDYHFMGEVYPKPAARAAMGLKAHADGSSHSSGAAHAAGSCDCVCVTLDTGARIELGPQATADQLRTVIENVR